MVWSGYNKETHTGDWNLMATIGSIPTFFLKKHAAIQNLEMCFLTTVNDNVSHNVSKCISQSWLTLFIMPVFQTSTRDLQAPQSGFLDFFLHSNCIIVTSRNNIRWFFPPLAEFRLQWLLGYCVSPALQQSLATGNRYSLPNQHACSDASELWLKTDNISRANRLIFHWFQKKKLGSFPCSGTATLV